MVVGDATRSTIGPTKGAIGSINREIWSFLVFGKTRLESRLTAASMDRMSVVCNGTWTDDGIDSSQTS